VTQLPWFISYLVGSMSLLSSYIVGKKLWWGWAINIANLFVLAYINFHFHLYGLVVVNIIMLYVFQKNAREWYKNRHERT
jgi:hypothetical protein